MANNIEQKEAKRMSSIARRLQWRVTGKQLEVYVKMDILLFVVLFFGEILRKEYEAVGGFPRECIRVVRHWKQIKECTYIVMDPNEQVLFSYDICPILFFLGIAVGTLFCIQMMGLLFSAHKEKTRISKILEPINEIALRADELSRFAFTEDKYHLIEDAISNVSPKDEQILSFGDSELQGIEVAMNNLLQRMREAYRQQARFVNDASHELRTPIAVIEGYINMIARWGREDEKVLDESIAALQRESGHMKKLVEQLLFLARGDSGKLQLELKEISVSALMQEIYEESILIDEEHVYRFRGQEELYITADEQMIKQAVRVLLDNAAKYTPENEEICLSVGKYQDGQVYLQVQDSGIGMSGEDVSHMFERFYRADDVRKYKGTGLGLSIAKWIVDKHEGHFEILSRTQLGTRIRIVLPESRGL